MMKRSPGRPRTYDSDVALDAALEAFWQRGYSGTTLDDLSAATGMNRPSLYRAFGDKKSIYRSALEKFSDEFLERLETELFAGVSLEQDLIGYYMAAASTYRSGTSDGLGCPVICTAATESVMDNDIQADLAGALERIDRSLRRRFRQARDCNELPPAADTASLGVLAGALLHSLAVRVRARQTGFDAEKFIKTSVAGLIRA